jgi:hypothetical protein
MKVTTVTWNRKEIQLYDWGKWNKNLKLLEWNLGFISLSKNFDKNHLIILIYTCIKKIKNNE